MRRAARITDGQLLALVEALDRGTHDASLGSNVYKMRLARPGGGNSGGFRILVAHRVAESFLFAKNESGNVSRDELRALRAIAEAHARRTDPELDLLNPPTMPNPDSSPESRPTDPVTGQPYRSRLLGQMHRAARDPDRHGFLEPATMRDFDRACLTPVATMDAAEIRAVREREGVSQAVFAVHLNASPKAVEAWEAGTRRPTGPTLELLTLAKQHGLEYIR